MAFVSISYRSEADRCAKDALQERRCRAKASKHAFIGASALPAIRDSTLCMQQLHQEAKMWRPVSDPHARQHAHCMWVLSKSHPGRQIRQCESWPGQVQGQMQLQEDAKCHGRCSMI